MQTLGGWMAMLALWALPAAAQPSSPPALTLTFAGETETVFTPKRDACDGNDVPDAPLRAFHDADGKVAAFGLHFVNRALRGDTLDKIKLDCRVVLGSGHNADPAAYDDYNWITAVWTDDGRTVDALIHQEYHGSEHQGRCSYKDYMPCWWNAIVGYRSTDAGASFVRASKAPVVAAPPFGQEQFQGRHRGFFNPSNIVGSGPYRYFMASTTGWGGQPYGVCLFRTRNPADSASWRAWDGSAYTVRFGDPYAGGAKPDKPCQPIPPLQAPVGSVTLHTPTRTWLAVYQASKDDKYHPLAGFYYAASKNLTDWSLPRLLVAGATLYDDPCKSPGGLIAYPSLLDPASKARNFDEAGDAAQVYWASLETKGCQITSKRDLMRRPVKFTISR